MRDIEHRLAAAAGAVREHELTTRRCADLRERIEQTGAELAALRARYADERKDVERLEGLSLTRVLVALRGAREDVLSQERAEADAARYRVAEAEARLDALQEEHTTAQAQLAQLATAPTLLASVLEEKERYLRESGDPRGVRLLALADERGRLNGEFRELSQAVEAARGAYAALAQVQDILGSASGWSTYDTFFGGGALSSAMKHSRLDEAAQAAQYADRRLALLRTELADVPGLSLTAPQLAIDGLTRFVDIWFDNIFTDLAVRDQIQQAQANVERAMHLVRRVDDRLRQRGADVRARLAAIETERERLLVTPQNPRGRSR